MLTAGYCFAYILFPAVISARHMDFSLPAIKSNHNKRPVCPVRAEFLMPTTPLVFCDTGYYLTVPFPVSLHDFVADSAPGFQSSPLLSH